MRSPRFQLFFIFLQRQAVVTLWLKSRAGYLKKLVGGCPYVISNLNLDEQCRRCT